ncbi:MAG: OmpA family protein [Planctomycetota bacterium]
MMRKTPALIAAVGLTVLATGCQNRMHDENLALFEENKALRDRMAQQKAGTVDGQTFIDLQNQLAAAEAEINSLQAQLNGAALAGAPMDDIAGLETEMNAATGEMTVRVPGDVLFASGVAEIKDEAKATLDEVARVLESDYAGMPVRVEGHTDADPVTKTKAQFTDNFGLSSARALTVMRYLQSQGVDPTRLSAVGHGMNVPRGGEKSEDRRVEIVVVTR